MTLGERIKTLRQEQGLSQEVLAERLGVSRQAVSKWEKDLSRPDTENLLALASVFGVSIDELAGNKAESAGEHTHRRPTLGRVVFTAVLTLAVVLGVIAALHFFGRTPHRRREPSQLSGKRTERTRRGRSMLRFMYSATIKI
ncbi:MAG: helix-turn-helix transcriptional regulator [Oscillospiraceae bacterium]|nr:helix-turn-helix transcriptional regulator [Oscillospiraceae bacterium]